MNEKLKLQKAMRDVEKLDNLSLSQSSLKQAYIKMYGRVPENQSKLSAKLSTPQIERPSKSLES